MDAKWTSFVVVMLAQVLPMLGVRVGDDQLSAFVFVGVSIASALVGIVAGWRKGDFTLGGKSLSR